MDPTISAYPLIMQYTDSSNAFKLLSTVICAKNKAECLNINNQVDTSVYAEKVQCLNKIRNKKQVEIV